MLKDVIVSIVGFLTIRGVLGIWQDCNYWCHKDFNIANLKDWLMGFKR